MAVTTACHEAGEALLPFYDNHINCNTQRYQEKPRDLRLNLNVDTIFLNVLTCSTIFRESKRVGICDCLEEIFGPEYTNVIRHRLKHLALSIIAASHLRKGGMGIEGLEELSILHDLGEANEFELVGVERYVAVKVWPAQLRRVWQHVPWAPENLKNGWCIRKKDDSKALKRAKKYELRK